jgi:hypothetical protein
MNELALNPVIIKPFIKPKKRPHKIPTIGASEVYPLEATIAAIQPDIAKIAPTERSKFPLIIAIVIADATIPTSTDWSNILCMFLTVKNAGVDNERIKNRIIKANIIP